MTNKWIEKIEYLESCLRAADYNVQENQKLLKQAWEENSRLAEEIGKLKNAREQKITSGGIKKLVIIALVIMMTSGCSSIKNNVKLWDRHDTAYQATYLTLTTIDWAQTRWMTRQDWQWDGNNYKELNPLFLDNKPHTDATWLIPVGMALHTGIAMALPRESKICGLKLNPRRIWQLLFISGEIGATINNYSAGVKIEF
jgi:uncharacterized protein YceK